MTGQSSGDPERATADTIDLGFDALGNALFGATARGWRVELVPHSRGSQYLGLQRLYALRVRFRADADRARLDREHWRSYWRELDSYLLSWRKATGATWEPVHRLQGGVENYLQANVQVWQAPVRRDNPAPGAPKGAVFLGAPASGPAVLAAPVAAELSLSFTTAACDALARNGVDPVDDTAAAFAAQTEALKNALTGKLAGVVAMDEFDAAYNARESLDEFDREHLVVWCDVPDKILKAEAVRRGEPLARLQRRVGEIRRKVEEREKKDHGATAWVRQHLTERALSDGEYSMSPNDNRFHERAALAAVLLTQLGAAERDDITWCDWSNLRRRVRDHVTLTSDQVRLSETNTS